ncbi:hypothetical protein PQX77_018311 [Marasmius sp. AFHP31]|nr:hypothetical protein PQX77_018311 [Marasmius sp. AFHP31]
MLEHADIYMEMLVDIGFGYNRIMSLLDNPGFYNLLYSSSFNNLLRRFPLEHLSDYALEVLVHITTDSGMLEEFANGDLVPFLVNLLEKELEHLNSLEEHDKPIRTRQLSPSSRRKPYGPMSLRPGSSPSQGPTTVHPVTTHPTSTPALSVSFPDGSSVIPLQRSRQSILTAQSVIGAQSRVPSPTPHKSSTPHSHTSLTHKPPSFQRVPSPNSLPVWSTSPCVNSSGICPSSAFNSHHASRHTVDHVAQPHSNHVPIVISHETLGTTDSFEPKFLEIEEEPQALYPNEGAGLRSGTARGSTNTPKVFDRLDAAPEQSFLQFAPTSNTLLVESVLPHVNNSGSNSSSAIRSQVPQCPINHVSPPLTALSLIETSPTSSTISHGHHPSTRSHPTLSKFNYKTHSGATQRSPQFGSRQNALDTQGYFLGGVDQHESQQRGIHHDSPSSLQHRPHSVVNPTTTPSAFIPDFFVIPSQLPNPFPHSITESMPQPSEQSSRWFISNHMGQSWHTEDTHIGENSSRASETSTLVHQSSSDWWDRDWSSDSLCSSDNEEDCIKETSQYSDSYSGTPHEDTPHLEHEPGEPEELDVNGSQLGYPHDTSYDSDGASQQPHNLEIRLDHSLDPGEIYNEVDAAWDDPGDETGQCSRDLDQEIDNAQVVEESYDDSPYDSEYEDGASQYSVDLEIGPECESLYEFDETGSGDSLHGENEEYNDGASQRSEDWSIPPDEQSDQGYESPCENDEYYEDKDHQYEYGNDEGPYHHLALIPQHFPRTLWSLQLPKSLHLNEFTKYGPASEPSMHYLFDITLIHTISTHIPLLITLAAFKLFVQSTIHQFIQGLQLSRQFVTPLEGSSGTDVIVEYREHILLPIEHDDTASKIWDEDIEVTHDAMDELFGVGSTSIFSSPSEEVEASVTQDWHPTVGLSSHDERYESSNSRDFTNPNSLDGWRSAEPYEYEESQLNDSGNDMCQEYLAIISPSFPLALQYLQSPKTRNQLQSRTSGLSPHCDTVHTPVFAALAPLDWVEMLDEEAVPKTASNQHLEWSPINGYSVPVHPSTYHNPLNGFETTGSYVYRTHNDNLGPTTSPKTLEIQQSYVMPMIMLFVSSLDLVDMTAKTQLKRLRPSNRGTARKSTSVQHHQWRTSRVSNAPSFVDTRITNHRAWQSVPIVPINGVPTLAPISAHTHAPSPSDLDHYFPINTIQGRAKLQDQDESSRYDRVSSQASQSKQLPPSHVMRNTNTGLDSCGITLVALPVVSGQHTRIWTPQVLGDGILLRKSEGLKGGVKTHKPNKPDPHFFFALPPNGVFSREPDDFASSGEDSNPKWKPAPTSIVIHHGNPTDPHPTSPLSSTPSIILCVQAILVFSDSSICGQDDLSFELSKNSLRTSLHSNGSRTASSSRIDPHELDFLLATFILPPVSRSGFIFCDESLPISIVVDKITTNLCGRSRSLLDTPSPILSSQTSIKYARPQTDQPCHHSIHFPLPLTRSKLDHRNGYLSSNIATNGTENLFNCSPMKGDRQLAASRVLQDGSPPSLHPQIDADVRSSGYLHPNRPHSFLAAPSDNEAIGITANGQSRKKSKGIGCNAPITNQSERSLGPGKPRQVSPVLTSTSSSGHGSQDGPKQLGLSGKEPMLSMGSQVDGRNGRLANDIPAPKLSFPSQITPTLQIGDLLLPSLPNQSVLAGSRFTDCPEQLRLSDKEPMLTAGGQDYGRNRRLADDLPNQNLDSPKTTKAVLTVEQPRSYRSTVHGRRLSYGSKRSNKQASSPTEMSSRDSLQSTFRSTLSIHARTGDGVFTSAPDSPRITVHSSPSLAQIMVQLDTSGQPDFPPTLFLPATLPYSPYRNSQHLVSPPFRINDRILPCHPTTLPYPPRRNSQHRVTSSIAVLSTPPRTRLYQRPKSAEAASIAANNQPNARRVDGVRSSCSPHISSRPSCLFLSGSLARSFTKRPSRSIMTLPNPAPALGRILETISLDLREGRPVRNPRVSDVPPTTPHLFICTSKMLTWVLSTVSLSGIWDMPSSKWNPHVMDGSSSDTQTNPQSELSNAAVEKNSRVVGTSTLLTPILWLILETISLNSYERRLVSTPQTWDITPLHLSLTRLGAATGRTLETLVFGVELKIRAYATTTQTIQHRNKKENHDGLPHIQQSCISDRLKRQYPIPREATRIMFVAGQRGLSPTTLFSATLSFPSHHTDSPSYRVNSQVYGNVLIRSVTHKTCYSNSRPSITGPRVKLQPVLNTRARRSKFVCQLAQERLKMINLSTMMVHDTDSDHLSWVLILHNQRDCRVSSCLPRDTLEQTTDELFLSLPFLFSIGMFLSQSYRLVKLLSIPRTQRFDAIDEAAINAANDQYIETVEGYNTPERSMVLISPYHPRSLPFSASPGPFPGPTIAHPSDFSTVASIQIRRGERLLGSEDTGPNLPKSIQHSANLSQRNDSPVDNPLVLPSDLHSCLASSFCNLFLLDKKNPFYPHYTSTMPRIIVSPNPVVIIIAATFTGLLMIEVGKQRRKAYVMGTQTRCSVVEIHFVGSHATNGPRLCLQLFDTPQGMLVRGAMPKSSQSGPPEMVFEGYKLERVPTHHTSHWEITPTVTSAF